jgi:hypothetical protein
LWFSKRNFAALIFALAPAMAAAQTPASNLQLTLRLFDRVALQISREISGDGIAAIWLKPPAGEKAEERFLFSRLITVFKDSLRLPVFTGPLDTARALAVTYRMHRCEIIYQPLSPRRLWQRARRQRLAKVLVEAGAQDTSTGRVYFQRVFEQSLADTVAENTLPRLEDQSFPFTIGRREARERGSRWLEPVLITSATGVVVYLFYSLRSR